MAGDNLIQNYPLIYEMELSLQGARGKFYGENGGRDPSGRRGGEEEGSGG